MDKSHLLLLLLHFTHLCVINDVYMKSVPVIVLVDHVVMLRLVVVAQEGGSFPLLPPSPPTPTPSVHSLQSQPCRKRAKVTLASEPFTLTFYPNIQKRVVTYCYCSGFNFLTDKQNMFLYFFPRLSNKKC